MLSGFSFEVCKPLATGGAIELCWADIGNEATLTVYEVVPGHESRSTVLDVGFVYEDEAPALATYLSICRWSCNDFIANIDFIEESAEGEHCVSFDVLFAVLANLRTHVKRL